MLDPTVQVAVVTVLGGLLTAAIATPIRINKKNKKPREETQEKLDKIVKKVDTNDLKLNTLIDKVVTNESKLNQSRDKLEAYKIDQAILDLSTANWEILDNEDKIISWFMQERWNMLVRNLSKLQAEDLWSREVKRETDKVRGILDTKGVKNHE